LSGIDEQLCDIKVCPNCGKHVLTWPFVGDGKGHFNIDTGSSSNLNNTVFLYEGMMFSSIEHTYCYGCNHKYERGSLMFKSIIREARKAKMGE